MNSFYFDKMHMLYNQNISCVKSCQKTLLFLKNNIVFQKTHCFRKNPIVFQHVHFFIPLFWNEKLSLRITIKNVSILESICIIVCELILILII